jgi:hypothetical protein
LFDDGTKLTEKGVWHKINGQNYHWNEPHAGLKYGIVLYKQKANTSKATADGRCQKEKENRRTTEPTDRGNRQ